MATTIAVRIVCFTCEHVVEVDLLALGDDDHCPECDCPLGEVRRVEGFKMVSGEVAE